MRAALLLALVSVAAAACSPYEKRAGEYYAGPVDPAAFPAAYRAAHVVASAATAHGEAAPYYAFAAASDAADAPLAPPLAYRFDAFTPRPPPLPHCAPTAMYDARRDAYRPDEQGNVFTALPSAPGYTPVVAEVRVTSNGEACQSIKSEATLVTAPDVIVKTMAPAPPLPGTTAVGVPDGTYLAWAIIDPGADVRDPDGSPARSDGLGTEQLGWLDHYLVAYLDGGALPTMTTVTLPGMSGAPATVIVRAVPQRLLFPTQIPVTDASGAVAPGPGALGAGFDLLDARRGEAGYSPLCHVFSFAPADPLHPPTSAADVDAAALQDTGSFVWCLQVQP